MPQFHLAQVNIGRLRGALTAPAMAEFAARIAGMNQLAEHSKGFVWRPHGNEVTPETLRAFENYFIPFDVTRLFYNLSVWESPEDLRSYVFKTMHSEMLRDKRNWMEDFASASLALWWIPAGQQPTVAESAKRLQSVDVNGATPFAFTFQTVFPAPVA